MLSAMINLVKYVSMYDNRKKHFSNSLYRKWKHNVPQCTCMLNKIIKCKTSFLSITPFKSHLLQTVSKVYFVLHIMLLHIYGLIFNKDRHSTCESKSYLIHIILIFIALYIYFWQINTNYALVFLRTKIFILIMYINVRYY